MFLVSAEVGPFKSINTPSLVEIDSDTTVFVGMNEAGKTVFLQALQKSDDALKLASFDPVDDYPRKDLSAYLKKHKEEPEQVTTLTYRLTDTEVTLLNSHFKTSLERGFTFNVTHKYDNAKTIGITVDERPILSTFLKDPRLSTDAIAAVKKTVSIRQLIEELKRINLTENDTAFLAEIESRASKTKWQSVVQWEVWNWLSKRLPKFVYFGDYELLPSKCNLADLSQRVEQAKTDPNRLSPEHRAVLALLRMADISVTDFADPGGYEPLKAKIEGVSINLTDQIMEFWKQNENLEVEVDIRNDPQDDPPFNNGPNLYIRIKNRRHRGVSTPFRQRSRGFIWFFSFLVWFDNVQFQLDQASHGQSADRNLILLLDEPGLSLHALAQEDLLNYIDDLSKRHQVIFTTHSPFMVKSDRLHQVRVVEDRDKIGTVISDKLSGSDPRTLFPLQAALGWSVAQNLFISERNLLVEGPSELIYLKAISAMLESQKRTGLREDLTIVPTGGLDKVVTFVALLGASGLKLAVLHDYKGAPEQKLVDLIKQKMISVKAVLNPSQFRDLKKIGIEGPSSDTEDLFTPSLYLKWFNKTFEKDLAGKVIGEKDLPPGDRIVGRLEQYLKKNGISLRPSGGYNHYLVASYIASHPQKVDGDTLARFEAMFKTINSIF